MLSAASVDAWSFDGKQGCCIRTSHYAIYTTLRDENLMGSLPPLMEGALEQYRSLAPRVALSDRPMECYVFNARPEFDSYTIHNTGGDARIYLMIHKGGYTFGDRFVAYYLGPLATSSIAAHEGWHQFVARHFKGRLPPFLEEGIACMFEGVSWQNDQPRWDLSYNPVRMQELHKVWNLHAMIPLEKLVMLHAGAVVEHAGQRVDAFYAQSWAFARFLCEAENGRFRPALEQWIEDTADGTVFDPAHSHNSLTAPWNPAGVPQMIEHYLGMPLGDVEKSYMTWVEQTLKADEETGN